MNEYLQAIEEAKIPTENWFGVRQFNSWARSTGPRRGDFVHRFSWAIPSDEAVALVARYSPLIEIGAGTGFWAKLLHEAGADILAFDSSPPTINSDNNHFHKNVACWSNVLVGGPEKITKHPDHTLFLCWPTAGFHDSRQVPDCLDIYRGERVVYIGETGDGCTGWDDRLDSKFVVEHEMTLPQWSGLHDRLLVLSRRKG